MAIRSWKFLRSGACRTRSSLPTVKRSRLGRGLAPRGVGRLADGRSVVIEVRRLEGKVPRALVPWVRVEHNDPQAFLCWTRESVEGESVGIPSSEASPAALLQWLTPVGDAVDWARQHSSFGLCAGPDELVWHGGQARVAGWGREAFDRLVTCRNGETRVGVMEPEIGATLRQGHIPLKKLIDVSPNADASVAALISTWLKLRLGKRQVWYAYQLDSLDEKERDMLMSWLESEPSRGGAAEFLRELGSALP